MPLRAGDFKTTSVTGHAIDPITLDQNVSQSISPADDGINLAFIGPCFPPRREGRGVLEQTSARLDVCRRQRLDHLGIPGHQVRQRDRARALCEGLARLMVGRESLDRRGDRCLFLLAPVSDVLRLGLLLPRLRLRHAHESRIASPFLACGSRPMDGAHHRTIQRALEVVVTKERLAAALKVPIDDLEAYLKGEKPVPPQVFLDALDIVAARRG